MPQLLTMLAVQLLLPLAMTVLLTEHALAGEVNVAIKLADAPDARLEESRVSEDDSISRWLDGLKAGDPADIERLWDRYFHRLVGLAAARLPGHARRDFDEEDVALSAFHSFCHRAADSQFPWLDDRNDLWRLLATITARKAISRIRQQTRQRLRRPFQQKLKFKKKSTPQ